MRDKFRGYATSWVSGQYTNYCPQKSLGDTELEFTYTRVNFLLPNKNLSAKYVLAHFSSESWPILLAL